MLPPTLCNVKKKKKPTLLIVLTILFLSRKSNVKMS